MDEKRTVPFKDGLFVFSDGSEQGAYLLGVRCNACGRHAFPSRPLCIFCHSKDVVQTPLSRTGILHSYTICRVPVPFMDPPYAIGYIDLPEGVRIFSQLEDWSEDGLKIGMQMELVVGRLKTDGEGNDIVTYKFRPIAQ